jgi:hypothetical protein
MPAFAPVESPELDEDVADIVKVVNDVLEVPPEVVVLGLGLDEDDEDVEEMKSASLYLMETPNPFTASVFGWSVTVRGVSATASVAVVVSTTINRDTQACPGKLKSDRV